MTEDDAGPTGLDTAPTVDATPHGSADPTVDVAEGVARYTYQALLGEGGMGQVHLCHDALIGREVALKRGRPDVVTDAEHRARFVREARVQGQLEHPGIVPVYDIGAAADGTPYFTMKCIRGLTLADVVARLAAGDAAIAARFSQRRLLAAFVSVCHAVDYAHGRGVLHRDLKPSNIMLGEYGEVSVLDWGVARPTLDPTADGGVRSVDPTLPGDLAAPSIVGALVGTPGYIPPEYLLDQTVAPTGDVFALGAILFELLALAPLIPRSSIAAVIALTVQGTDARPSQRAPTHAIAPELDAICVRATAADPAARYPSVRALADDVERYLEGDRDLLRRRELAAEKVRAAEAGLAASADEAARGRAMRELGHALGLDPDNAAARAAMLRLLTTPPRETPAEVRAALASSADEQLRLGAALGAVVLLTWFLFVPVFYWLGVHDWGIAPWVLVPIGISALLSFLQSRRARISAPLQYATFAFALFAVAALSRLFGPFVLVPTVAAGYAVGVQVHPHAFARRVVVAMAALAMLGPAILEEVGVLSRTVFVRDHELVIRTLGSLREGPTLLVLSALGVIVMVGATVFVVRQRSALSEAQERVHLHAWHVQRMMPEGVVAPPASV